jgi:hypothetical protein
MKESGIIFVSLRETPKLINIPDLNQIGLRTFIGRNNSEKEMQPNICHMAHHTHYRLTSNG